MNRLSVLVVCLVVGMVAFRVSATEISEVRVSNITDTSATINWTTDIETDGTVNYGLDSRVGVMRNPLFDTKEHSVTLDRLIPGTTYYFRVTSADDSGNRSTTAGFVFNTKNADTSVADRIIEELDDVTEPEDIAKIQEKLQEVVSDVGGPPSIVGPPRVSPGSGDATISWTTDRESSSMVYLSPADEYRPGTKNSYRIVQGDPRSLVTKHSVKVTGLQSATEYHFKVASEDVAGLTGESEDSTFRTLSVLPEILNPRVSRVQETSAVVSWSTGGVRAKGIVEYTNQRTKVTKLAGNPVFATTHSIQLNDLEFGARYSAVIRSTNEGGDEVVGSPLTFTTVRDRVPPAISKVNNESTLYPGEDTKIQTIVAWETDEPALCQVSYSQGLARAEGDEGDSLPAETNPVTTHTQVIVGFASATVYQFWMICKDEAGNAARSEDFVLITPVKEKNIIDIILENFEGTFGWVKNITQ